MNSWVILGGIFLPSTSYLFKIPFSTNNFQATNTLEIQIHLFSNTLLTRLIFNQSRKLELPSCGCTPTPTNPVAANPPMNVSYIVITVFCLVTVIFDPQSLRSSFSNSSECICQIWRNSSKVFLRYRASTKRWDVYIFWIWHLLSSRFISAEHIFRSAAISSLQSQTTLHEC